MMTEDYRWSEFALSELEGFIKSLSSPKGSPLLVWNSRLRTTAGRYRKSLNLIELNPHLLNTEIRVRETVGHEYAHAVATNKAPRESSHGPTWKSVMMKLGLTPNVCHTYEVSDFRRYSKLLKVYECPVCKVQWKVRRKYASNCYHRCDYNKKRVRVRFITTEAVSVYKDAEQLSLI